MQKDFRCYLSPDTKYKTREGGKYGYKNIKGQYMGSS